MVEWKDLNVPYPTMKLLKPEYINSDKRRTLTQLITANIKQVNLYEAHHGENLGNHFHKETIEYFYVVRGTLEYNKTNIMKKGDLFYPDLGEKHTVKAISDTCVFMTFLTKPYNQGSPDVYVE